jgi:hypothetical protein
VATRGARERFGEVLKRSFWILSTIGALAFLAYGGYLAYGQLTSQAWSLDYRYMLCSLPLYWGALAIAIANWHSIIGSLGARLGFRRNMKLYCFTNLSRQLPGILWFVGTRVFKYEREGVPKAVTSASIVLELALLTFSNLLVCLLIMPALPQLDLAQRALLVLLLLPLVLVVVWPRVLIRVMNRLLAWVGRPGLSASPRGRNMVAWSALYSLAWLLGGLFLYALVLAVSPVAPPHPVEIVAAWALSNLVSKLRFVLPIGIGWSEVSLAYLLSLAMPLPTAIIITVLSWLWLAANEGFWFLASLAL